jgi:secreted trypsin-like serine protease
VAGEWPWMTALFHSQGNADRPPYFKCGATLLSDKWIATAAHCTLALPQIFSVSYVQFLHIIPLILISSKHQSM